MELVGVKTYDCVVKQKFGTIPAKFKFTTTLIATNPPTHLKEIDKAGTSDPETTVDLKEFPAQEVPHRSNITIGKASPSHLCIQDNDSKSKGHRTTVYSGSTGET